jgi:RHS repeat-associated protein
LPKQLAAGTKTTDFSYGGGRERYKQVQKTGSTTDATIYYVGTLFEKEIAGATTTYRHNVSARGRMIATVNRVGTAETVQYLHRDHQNSVVEVTAANGTLVQSLAFDAWGLRRNAATWAALGSPFGGSEVTERGYTGHEHLDSVELIHMNGRVQDPRLGRFVSPDPLVQAPFHTQGFDRYTYVRNNPTTLIDPSGYDTEVLVVTGSRAQVVPSYLSSAFLFEFPVFPTPLGMVPVVGSPAETGSAATPSEPDQRPEEVTVTAKCPSGVGGACSTRTELSVGQLIRQGWNEYVAWRQANLNHQLELLDAVSHGDQQATQELAMMFVGGGMTKIAGLSSAARGTAAAVERGTTVLGRYPGYLNTAKSLGARYLDVPPARWARMTPAEQWAANTRFLDRLIGRGDDVVLSTAAREAAPNSFFARELEYLTSRGYTISDDGMRLLAPR